MRNPLLDEADLLKDCDFTQLRIWFATGSALLFRRENHDHLAAFELGLMFDLRDVLKFFLHAVHQRRAELLMRHFTTAEAKGHLGLVAVVQEADEAAQLRLEVVFVRCRAELHFLHLDNLLLGLGFLGLFLFLVAELAVVHQTADRRNRLGGDFDEIDVGFFGHAKGFGGTNNTDLGAVDASQSDFGNSDLTIDPMLAILSYGSSPVVAPFCPKIGL